MQQHMNASAPFIHVSRHEFNRIIERAVSRIPREIRARIDNVAIRVETRPSRALLKEMGVPRGETLLGLYDGVALTERSIEDMPARPDCILLFQEPIEEMCDSVEEIEREVEITIVHEIAHFFGIEEERLDALGYG